MYQSPIEIHHKTIGGLTTDIAKKTDEMVVNACLEIGIKVDRDELIKMAKYDREQYEKGYEDGQVSGAIRVLEHIMGAIDKHMAELMLADTQAQEIYMMGERHIRDIIEVYLEGLKNGTIEYNRMGGDSV